jgi:hypothetical protein
MTNQRKAEIVFKLALEQFPFDRDPESSRFT